MAIRILALDQSAYTGFAHGAPGTTPIYGTHRLPAGLTGAKRARALYKFVRDLCIANEIDKIYFEEPIIPKVTGFKTVYGLMGLATAIGFAADELGIVCIPITMQTWRSEFGVPTQAPRAMKDKTERRAWVKQQTINRCRQIGLDPQDDNASDAIGLWWACCQRVISREAAPAFSFLDNLKL